jgi:hypothetical protein
LPPFFHCGYRTYSYFLQLYFPEAALELQAALLTGARNRGLDDVEELQKDFLTEAGAEEPLPMARMAEVLASFGVDLVGNDGVRAIVEKVRRSAAGLCSP